MQNFDILVRNIYWIFGSVFAASLAFPSPPIHLLSLGVISIFAIIHSFYKSPRFNKKNTLLLSLLFGYFIINAISYLLNDKDGLFDSKLIRLSYLFLVPLVIVLGPTVKKENIKRLINFTHLSIFIFCSIGICKVFWLYKLGLVSKVSYSSYADVLGFHSTLISLLVTLAYVHIIFTFFTIRKNSDVILNLFLQAFYLIVLYFLAVRISFIAIGAITIVIFIYKIVKGVRWNKLVFLVAIPVLMLLTSVVFFSSTYTLKRFTEINDSQSSEISDLENRKILWSCGLEVFLKSKNYFFGNGLRISQTQLNDCYIAKDNLSAAEQNYSTHNQYIQALVDTGIIGFLFFILFICYLLYLCLRSPNFLMLGFLTVFLFFFLTESLFNRAYGILLFSSIVGFYINYISNNREKHV